jgi:group II intron reverse transcriptase/maturase
MAGTPIPGNVSTRLQRIAELAREAPQRAFLSLAHHIDVELLREAYRRTRKSGAPGVDGETAEKYAENLEANLQSLLDRFLSGTYKAPPVRRVHIPKGDGQKTRPIGIPTFEDKILQRAVAMVLSAMYEQDFLDVSYGFRPGRSAHQALADLWLRLTETGGGWVLEVDIQSFYESLDHSHLRSFLDHRVLDGVLRRSIDKWLKAGVLEEGELSYPEAGTPQGGVISPLLSNLYLHEVLDQWFEREVKPRLQGESRLIRYADDFVLVFSRKGDAQRVMEVLPKRFGRFGLRLHPEKTRLVRFRKPRLEARPNQQERPGSFDLLGFTHYWGRSLRGGWVVKRRTARDRLRRAIKRANEWCRKYRHYPVGRQHGRLVSKLRGHYEYYGITGNSYALVELSYRVWQLWRRWLSRRSQKGRLSKAQYKRLLERYPLPSPIAVHSRYRRAAKPCT